MRIRRDFVEGSQSQRDFSLNPNFLVLWPWTILEAEFYDSPQDDPLVYKPDALAKGTQVFPERKDERKWISCWLWSGLLVVRVSIKGTHVGTSGASGRHVQPGWLPAKRRDLSPTTIGPRFSQQSHEPGKGPGTRERDTSSAAYETLSRGPSPWGLRSWSSENCEIINWRRQKPLSLWYFVAQESRQIQVSPLVNLRKHPSSHM